MMERVIALSEGKRRYVDIDLKAPVDFYTMFRLERLQNKNDLSILA